ncbi:very short patch repair endonuclease [Nonomuraea sp. C10]|nr:very short patch repair endonuclease [Nonomuraea sp. C10]
MGAVSGSGQWRDKPPPERAWKGRKGRSREVASAEQDRAAGGRQRRMVHLGDGRYACASIYLKLLPKTRRIRAYLRWSDKGRSPTRYIGEVNHGSREENLAQAWRMASEQGLAGERIVSKENARETESWASSPAVRAVMRGNKGRDTRPELALRSAIHALGLRYRVGIRPLPFVRRTADLVFTRDKVAVFLDGCYWHGCDQHYRPAQRNPEFWTAKIKANQNRDRETDRLLREAGWESVRVWEHEPPDAAAAQIAALLKQKRARA